MECTNNEISKNEALDAYFFMNPEAKVSNNYEIIFESFECMVKPNTIKFKYRFKESEESEEIVSKELELDHEELLKPWLVYTWDYNIIVKRSHVLSPYVTFETAAKFTNEFEWELSNGKKLIEGRNKDTSLIANFKLIDAYHLKLVLENEGIPNYIKNGKMVNVLGNSYFSSVSLKFDLSYVAPLKDYTLKIYNQNLEEIEITNPLIYFKIESY